MNKIVGPWSVTFAAFFILVLVSFEYVLADKTGGNSQQHQLDLCFGKLRIIALNVQYALPAVCLQYQTNF